MYVTVNMFVAVSPELFLPPIHELKEDNPQT